MSADRYVCCDEQRRTQLAKLAPPAKFSGIDFIEVNAGPTTADPTIIRIVLVNPLTAPAVLSGDNIKITGGVRFPPPKTDPNVTAAPGPATYSLTIPGGQPTHASTSRLA